LCTEKLVLNISLKDFSYINTNNTKIQKFPPHKQIFCINGIHQTKYETKIYFGTPFLSSNDDECRVRAPLDTFIHQFVHGF
jgi:hypothetical protein